jgi:hypothetical protein
MNVMTVDEDEDSLLSEGTPDSLKTYHLRGIYTRILVLAALYIKSQESGSKHKPPIA